MEPVQAEEVSGGGSDGDLTKKEMLKQLDAMSQRLNGLQAPPPSAALTRQVAKAAAKLKTDKDKINALLGTLDQLKAPDTESLLAPPLGAAPTESGVDRLQRHQRDINTQKLLSTTNGLILVNP